MKYPLMFVVVGLLTVDPIFVTTSDSKAQPPVINLYEVDASNRVLRPYERVDYQRSEVIVENLDHLRLECEANYPVQWIYTGNGLPVVSTDISFLATQEGTRQNRFTAALFISPLEEYHTGSYQCSRTEYLTRSPFIYIYVPGKTLFTSLQGNTIQIPRNKSHILIPCSVSHPGVQVTLEKLDGNGQNRPVSNDATVYDTRKGFRVNLRNVEGTPEGTYVCVARFKNDVKSVEYNVISESTRPSSNLLEFKQSTEEVVCKGEACGTHCDTHTDCPSMMNCYTDHLCRDPCSYSVRCGKASMCRVIENVPVCYCPRGFVGDATKECFER